MTSSLKQKVATMLAEANDEIIESFFQSDMTDKYSDKRWYNADHDNFLDSAKEVNVKFQHMDNYGGEGEGDDYWSVYKFTEGVNEVYVKFQGWYASYNGSEFSEWFFVIPKEVMVTEYFKE